MTAPKLVEHFFRHEYARLVAVMVRRSGVQHLTAIEDAVQSALMRALEVWKVTGTPDNPSGWLFRVAQNAFVSELRKRASRRQLLEQIAVESADLPEESQEHFRGEMHDDLLRMLFVCCDDAIPPESQLVLALKTLCGFSIEEIGLRLFASEAKVYKRLGRARIRLRALEVSTDDLTVEQMTSRLPVVSKVLYALFSEGYLSSGAEFAIRRDLCEEAIPVADIVTIRQVLQHLSNDQIARILPKLSVYGAIVVTEAVPVDVNFVPNVDHRPGFSTRLIESNSAVDLALAPFDLPHVEARVLCEPRTTGEQIPGRIRTTLYVTEKGRRLGL